MDSEVKLAALVEEIRREARDMTEAGEDASVMRGWANTIAAHLRTLATPPASGDAVAWQQREDSMLDGTFANDWRQITQQEFDALRERFGGATSGKIGDWTNEIRPLYTATPTRDAVGVNEARIIAAAKVLADLKREDGWLAVNRYNGDIPTTDWRDRQNAYLTGKEAAWDELTAALTGDPR